MGKRKRRGRCVKNNTNVNIEPEETVEAPHSFVIHKGLPGGNLLELTKDFRKVMEPFTAISLKVSLIIIWGFYYCSNLQERKKKTQLKILYLWLDHYMSRTCPFFREPKWGCILKFANCPGGPP
jgi:hypothetical protein